MFERILVPIDSADPPFSEHILDHVKRLLRREDSWIDLFSVVTPDSDDPDPPFRSMRLEGARRRLEVLAQGLRAEGIPTVSQARFGDALALVRDRIEKTKPSLIAMTTHGHSGPVRWVRGSVAEAILRQSDIPLLLCNPARVVSASGKRIRRILVPLDGSPTARQILPLASAFAERHGATLVLCRIGTAAYVPANGAAYFPSAVDTRAIEHSLAPIAKQLRDGGVAVATYTSFGNAASEILDAVEREKADFVMMVTHGYKDLDRLLFGSVAESVLRRCTTPIIVLRESSVSI